MFNFFAFRLSKKSHLFFQFFNFVCVCLFGGYDDGVSVYFYDGMPGCACFYHCTCFSHYIGPFDASLQHLESGAFPKDTQWHPKSPEDIVWHEFMKGILTAKKKGPAIKCDASYFQYLLKYYSEQDTCLLSQYLNLIQNFQNIFENARADSIKYYEQTYKSPRNEKYRKEMVLSVNQRAEAAYQILSDLPSKIVHLYKSILEQCPHSHESNMVAIYHQGLINLLEGNYELSLEKINDLIAISEKYNNPHILNSKFYQQRGEAYLEVGLYHDAIESLTESIKKDPKNKEAYFDRATAYFESGKFNESLDDYLASKEKSADNHYDSKVSDEFRKALLLGLVQGANEALSDFFPSLLRSAHGIGMAYWALFSHPQEEFKKFADSCSYVADHAVEQFKQIDWNIEERCVEKFEEFCTNYNQLNDSERGELLGSFVGKYGIEILAGGTAVKSISALKKLKDANRLCNLEVMAASEANMEALTSTALMHSVEREKFLQNIKVRWDRQNKHLPGKHNFDPERGIIKISEAKLEELIKRHVGKGQRVSDAIPFTSGYKERVDFGEIIGEYALKVEGQKTTFIPTTKALIHYAKDGVHIVPSNPVSNKVITK